MRRMKSVFWRLAIVVALVGVGQVSTSSAQADRDTLLPDLAPRELEILGNLEITFPSLRRQPLSGFNPPPRIYEVPRGWRPWTGEYKQPSADLPGTSLIQPASPPATISVGQHPHNGELSMGIGRYLSREVRAQAAFDLGSSVTFHGDLFHEGLSKYKPFNDSLETEAPHQAYDGLAGLTYRAGATSAGIEVTGFFDEYDLYGARPDTAPFLSPERDGSGFGGRAWVSTGEASKVPVRLTAEYKATTYETGYPDEPGLVSIDGRQLALQGEGRFGVGDRNLSLDAKTWLTEQRGFFDPLENVSVEPSRDVTTYRAGGDLNFGVGRRGLLRVGAQLHGYSSSGDGVAVDSNGSSDSKVYLAPRISYVNLIASVAEIYVKNTPIVRVKDQHGLFDANPFLVDYAPLFPELSVVNVEGGLVFYKGPVRIAARSGVTTYESFLYFESDGSPAFGPRFFNARYGNADVFFAGGDVGVTFPGQFSATVSTRWQSAKLENDVDVPNYPEFEGGLRGSFIFADDRALIQFDGTIVGDRNVDSSGEEVVSGYLDMAVLASYYLRNGIGFYARIQTITGDTFERWVGYPVADWVTLGGIRIRW